jgi:peptide/nickel transport system ATP-binding protein
VNEKLLDVKNLSVTFERNSKRFTAVNEISFQIKKGECLGILGESGSGKSITALSIMRLVTSAENTAISGQINYNLNGTEVDLMKIPSFDMHQWRGKHIGMVFQEPMSSLNPVVNCGKQIAEAVKLHLKLNDSQVKRRTLELLNEVQIKNALSVYNAYPHELSGGQKQRVMIAMALAGNPALLIADEPTTSLDVTVQKEILELLVQLQVKQQMSMLFITHDFGVLTNIADRALVMNNGSIVEENNIANLLNAPNHRYTKALINCRIPLNSRFEKLPTLQQNFTGIAINNLERKAHLAQIYGQQPILKIENLAASYTRRSMLFSVDKEEVVALKNINIEIFPKETFGIVGESGSGKSTLGKCIVGLIQNTSGSIFFEGKAMNKLHPDELRNWRKQIQYVFQDPFAALNPKMSIGNAIMEPLEAHRLFRTHAERKTKTLELLSKVGLHESQFYRLPHEFSGGERQRICIARALAMYPKILICDESVSALDVSIQAQIINLLNDLKKEYGFSLIFISHDINIVRYVSERILVLKDGEMVELNDSDIVCSRPEKEYTKQLLAAAPKGTVEEYLVSQQKKKSILITYDN